MSIQSTLRDGALTKKLYIGLRDFRDDSQKRVRLAFHGKFVNRSKGREKLLIVLAGYKSFLYEEVLGRIQKFVDEDIDVCIITSGKSDSEIAEWCKKNNWSYLSTKENHVGLVQNAAIYLHPQARYIFKLDEDIFITEGYFKKMFSAYQHVLSEGYVPGAIAPIIPINGYGHVRVLEKLNLVDEYQQRFEKVQYQAGNDRMIENNPAVAKFFWGEEGIIPSIDELNRLFERDKQEERPCAIRFSIGAILFERNLWEDMNYFNVNLLNNGLGADEEKLCSFCCLESRPLMVSENIVVGHLSFGPQNAIMRDYYLHNKGKFSL